MEEHLIKLVARLTVVAVIAYIVASAVGKREQITESAAPKKMKAKGDVWQTPVAVFPSADSQWY